MKKFNFGLTIGLVIGFLLFSIPALADGIINVNLLVNGQKHNAELIMVNNKTYVPLRQFSELIGYRVDWNQKNNSISLSNDGKDYSNNVNNNVETGKNYTIAKNDKYTIVNFNDGFKISVTHNPPKEDDYEQYFFVAITNNSAKPVIFTSNMFKYVNEYNVNGNAEKYPDNLLYLNDSSIYPKTDKCGLIICDCNSNFKYLIYDDGIHYVEINDVVKSNISDTINAFNSLNSPLLKQLMNS